MAMGPFRVGDLAGLDIGWALRKRRAAEFPDRISPMWRMRCARRAASARRPARAGTGTRRGSRNAIPDPEVTAIIEHTAEKGITPRAVSNAGDRRALHLCARSMKAPAFSRTASRSASSDIDLVYLNGYGFPAYRGGPMFYADQTGLHDIARALERIALGPGSGRSVLDAGAAARASWPRRTEPSAEFKGSST